MSAYRTMIKSLAFSGFLASVTLQGALAWEADAVAERLKVLGSTQGVDLSWSNLSDDGTSITIDGLKAKPTGEDNAVDLGTVTLQDVTEDGDAYKVGEINLPSYETIRDNGSVSLQDIAISGLLLPKGESDEPMDGVMQYESAHLAGMQMKAKGKEIFTLTDMHVEMMPPGDDGALEFTVATDGFTLDLAAATEDAKRRAVVEKLGYAKLEGTAEMAGSWRPSDGRLMLSQNDLTINNAGTLGVTIDLSGYTAEFAKAMREMQAQMATNPNRDMSDQATAVLGLLQQLNLHGAVIRFDDDSLTGKLLEYAAEQQATDPAKVAEAIATMVPQRIEPYLGEQLTNEVRDALSAFLNDPQNLEIRAEPGSPVSFALLVGAAMMSPQSLPGQLGLKVEANK